MVKQYFFEDPQMEFEARILLGSCYYGAADAGEILTTLEQIPAGNCEQWFLQWSDLGRRMQQSAEQSRNAGNEVSAKQSFLRAATYFATSATFIDGTDNPARGVQAWENHLTCWEQFCSLLSPPAEKVGIPYEQTAMPGYFFRPDKGSGPWATIIFNNGSDGPTCGMWSGGVCAALQRGYAALVFDGPGQNGMLWQQNIPFRHDWEKVITPVVDFLVRRRDVDPSRIALSGISQGGYWILRALAFEHRLAAGIADPAVMDVSTSFFEQLPQEMREQLDAGLEEEFNQAMDQGLEEAGAAFRQMVEWRLKPYRAENFFQHYKLIEQYNVRKVIQQIQCPVFIADPDEEQFWPGQSQEVFDALTCPKTIVRFTAGEGANLHCEPMARGLYDQRMFDWLATVMKP